MPRPTASSGTSVCRRGRPYSTSGAASAVSVDSSSVGATTYWSWRFPRPRSRSHNGEAPKNGCGTAFTTSTRVPSQPPCSPARSTSTSAATSFPSWTTSDSWSTHADGYALEDSCTYSFVSGPSAGESRTTSRGSVASPRKRCRTSRTDGPSRNAVGSAGDTALFVSDERRRTD